MSTLRTAFGILRGAPQTRAVELMGTMGAAFTSASTTGAGTFDARETTFEYTAVAYRCLSLVASNLAAVPMTVLVNGEALDDHEVARLWNDGAPGSMDSSVSARVIREALFGRLELTGQSFAYIDRGDTGAEPARGIHVIYDRVEVVVGPGPRGIGEVILGFIVHTAKNGRVPLLPSEVLWLRYPHPTQRWGCLAPWRAALYPVESDGYARAWQRSEFKNGARPSAVINLGEVSDEVYHAALATVRTRTEGPDNAGKSMIVRSTPGSVAKPSVDFTSFSPEEMSYLASRVANADEVCMAFGVKPDLVRGNATYENVAASKTALWSDTLIAKLDVCASEIDRQLLPDQALAAAWDLSGVDALRDSQDAVIERATSGVFADLMTLDEARETMGLEGLPNGLGGYTLTEYRARVTGAAAAELVESGPAARASRPRLLRYGARTHTLSTVPALDRRTVAAPAVIAGRPVAVVTSVGNGDGARTVTAEVVTTRAAKNKPPTVGSVLATYDKHERVGRRLVKRLAARQAKAVKREIETQSRKNPGWAVQWRAELLAEVNAGRLAVRTMADGTRCAVPTQARAGVSMRIYDSTFWENETREALEPFVDHVWSDGGQRAADQFDATWEQLNPKVLEKMNARLGILSHRVTETTRQAIEARILDEGISEGESIDKLANRILDVFEQLGSSRAETIARTETVGGYNAAAHEVADELDIEFDRVWLATVDERTRESHAALNGRRLRDPDELWPNDCLFPGDPNGPADETINCRCVEIFEEVEE